MIHFLKVGLLPLGLAILALVGCAGEPAPNPVDAQNTYGTAVEVIDAIPVPAVVAELDRYVGRRVGIDGRIHRIEEGGCSVELETDTTLVVRVDAPTDGSGRCTWTLPTDASGILEARGRLMLLEDTLRVTAPGVTVIPLQGSTAGS